MINHGLNTNTIKKFKTLNYKTDKNVSIEKENPNRFDAAYNIDSLFMNAEFNSCIKYISYIYINTWMQPYICANK